MKLEKLRASLAGCPVVKFGEYQYFIHPLTDGIPPADPELLREAVEGLAALADWRRVDKIITAEAMGFPLAAALALRVHKPYLFVRKRRYGLPSELSMKQVTGYAGTDLFFNYVEKGDRLAFVDDVISTGGTLRAVVKALRFLGASVEEVLIVFEKTREKAKLEAELGVEVKTLVGVEVVDGRAVAR